MYRLVTTLLLLFITSSWVNAQCQSISEFDLYGFWILDESKDLSDDQKRVQQVFVQDSESYNEDRNYGIVFLAYDKCKFVNTQLSICGPRPYHNDYTWSFDPELNLINIYSGEEWLKEFKKFAPEELVKFGSPERFEEMTLKVKVQSDGNIMLVNVPQ